jgi:hypothetical protein
MKASFLTILAACAVASSSVAQDAPKDKDVMEWVGRITLRPGSGGSQSGTRRWTKSPTVSLINASKTDDGVGKLEEAAKEINESLAKTPLWPK